MRTVYLISYPGGGKFDFAGGQGSARVAVQT
jgi:hypothetical protein